MFKTAILPDSRIVSAFFAYIITCCNRNSNYYICCIKEKERIKNS